MKFSFPARNLIQLKSIITRTNKHQSSRSVQDSFFLFFLSFFPFFFSYKARHQRPHWESNQKQHFELRMQTKHRNYRSIARKYLPIRVGKREPLLEKLLDEGRIRFEGQGRYLRKLHQFGVERRRIVHDLHAHQNRTPCLSLIHNCQIKKTLQRIEARRS
jgi:hypothetical protein